MGEVLDADQEHLRLLQIGFYVLAAMSAIGILFALIFVGMGSFFASGAVHAPRGQADPRVVGWIFLAIGSFVMLSVAAMGILTFYAGKSIGERRRRIYCMIMAGLWCPSFPFGTVVGVCGLIVLSRASVKGLFQS